MLTTVLLAASAAVLPPVDLQDEVPAGSPTLPAALDPAFFRELCSQLFVDEPGDGRTWARGATYKASFGADGFTYTPFLGSDAPRSFPLELDLDRVTVAGEELGLADRSRARDGRTVSLDRGSVTEVYHLAERQVEQTFVFDALPVRGEIVLSMDVATELQAAVDGAGFVFSTDRGGVQYGGATAIDARGRERALEQRWTGDALEIVVPAEFVRSAELPLVVDPILSTFGVTNDNREQLEVDVAYDGQNSIYQIVWSQAESGFDQDVFCAYYNVGIGTLFGAVSLDITSSQWSMPRNASAYEAQQFLCVALVGNSIGNRRVWGRTRDAATGVRGPQFTISGIGAEHVDVGGKGNDVFTSYDYMVVWQQADPLNADFDIRAQAVNSNGTLTQSQIIIDGDADDLDRFPSISKSSGRPNTENSDNEYMIVWEREVGTDDRNIRCQVIEYTGSMAGHNQFRGYSFSDSRHPDVSTWSLINGYANERHWVVVFERRTGSDYDVFGVVARDGNADNAKSLAGMQDLDQTLDQLEPRIAYEGQDFLVAYRTPVSASQDVLYLTSVNVIHDDGELRLGSSIRRDFIANSLGETVRYGIASDYDGGTPNFVGTMALLPHVSTPISGDSEIAAAFVADFEDNVIGAQYCDAEQNSTGASAWIRANASEPPLAGFGLILNCVDLPANSFGHFLCSTQSGFVANPGGSSGNLCLQGAIGRFVGPGQVMNSGFDGTFSLTVDSSAFPTPTGTVSAVSGEAWYFQAWFRDFGPTSNFSNGIQVTFD
ncbi:MAG: hypothetical protein AAF726_11425 [Planctomycetota bacterium]